MLTANVIYHADTRTLEIQNISTGMDTVVVGTQGDDKTSKIHFIMDGNVSDFNEFYAEFDVKVPDQTKRTYIKPAIRLNNDLDAVLPSYVLSNVIKGVLPMQLSMLNKTTDIKAVSVNTVFFRVAEAIDADLSAYNVIVPEPVVTTAGVFTTVVGDGITSEFTLIHNLGTFDIGAWAYYNDTHASIPVEWQMEDEDSITVYLPDPPSELNATIVIYRAGNGIYENIVDVFPVSGASELTTLNHAKVGDLAYHKAVNDEDDTIIWTLMAEPYSTADNWQMTYTSGVDKGLQDEIERATNAELQLQSNIETEAGARGQADTALSGRITALETDTINTAGTYLTKSGRSLSHNTTSRTDTTTSPDPAAIANGGHFYIVDTVSTDNTAGGHVTGVNKTKITLPTYAAAAGIALDGLTFKHTNTVTADSTGKGTASKSATVKMDAQGHITALTDQDIQIAESQVTNLPDDLAGKAPNNHAGQDTQQNPYPYGKAAAQAYGHVQFDGAITGNRTDVTVSEKGIKDFVNSSIGTATANFLGTYKALADAQHPEKSLGFTQTQVDGMTDPYSTASGAIATALDAKVWVEVDGYTQFTTVDDYVGHYVDVGGTKTLVTDANKSSLSIIAGTTVAYDPPSPNDYVFVEMDFTTPATSPDEYRRYKFDGTGWAYEYTLNNSSYTQAQWDAIDSGITAAKVTTYDAHVSNTSNPHSVTKAQVGLGNVDNYGTVSAWQSTPDNTHIPTEKLTKDTLDTKVDKTTHPGQGIYLYGNTDSQVQVPCQTEPNQYTVAYRGSNGTIRVGTPTSDDHATTKKYVDDADATKVTGPSSAVSNNVVLFDGTTGKLVKDSGKTLGASIPAPTASQDEGKAIIVNSSGTGFIFGEAGKVDDVQINGASIVSNKIAVIPITATDIQITEVD